MNDKNSDFYLQNSEIQQQIRKMNEYIISNLDEWK